MMLPAHAVLLGIVEGLTEFLPVSSTGHLILASHVLGLNDESAKAFDVVIQAGALGAILGLYRGRVAQMARGLAGRDADGRALAMKLLAGFLPAAAAGVLFHREIKARLFATWPVILALGLGGIVMVLADPVLRTRRDVAGAIEGLPLGHAVCIGCAQVLALWPGTSRAMVTILSGLVLGLGPVAAAEYSFLLALPTLGAATLFDAAGSAGLLWREIGAVALVGGFASAALVAWVAVRGFVRYLSSHGLAPFGWYRIGLAAMLWWLMSRA